MHRRLNIDLYEGDHNQFCQVCKKRGALLCCDFCPNSFHPSCLVPSMPERPSVYWKCPICQNDEQNYDLEAIQKRRQDYKDDSPFFEPLRVIRPQSLNEVPQLRSMLLPHMSAASRKRPHTPPGDGQNHSSSYRGVYVKRSALSVDITEEASGMHRSKFMERRL